MKNTAHRSIDYPKGEPLNYRNSQALTFIGSQMYYHMNFQKFIMTSEINGKTIFNEFIPEIDHLQVMDESYSLICQIVKNIA